MLCVSLFVLREYLLAVLLFLAHELLREDPPTNRDTTLGGCLADSLLHVRGDQLLVVLCSSLVVL